MNDEERKLLYNRSINYENIFYGNLWESQTDSVDFELKEGDEPYNQRRYPVPHVHKEIVLKGVKKISKTGSSRKYSRV